MNCKRAKEQISLFLDERLDPSGQSKLNGHLEGCSDCSAYLDDLKTGLAMLKEEAMESPSDNFEWNLRRKLQVAMAQRETVSFDERGARRDLWRFGLSAAAALLIVVTGGTFWYQSQFSSGGPEFQGAEATTGLDENARQGRPGWVEPAPGSVRPVLDHSGGLPQGSELENARPQSASPADSVTGQDTD